MEKVLRAHRNIMLGLTLLGLLVATYLTWSHYNEGSALCAKGGGCDIVRASRYSEVVGIPVAIFGLVGYAAILAVLLLQTRSSRLEENAITILFGTTLAGFIYSAYLTYLELFVIHALCPYCVASAVIMTLLFLLSVYRLIDNFQKEANTP